MIQAHIAQFHLFRWYFQLFGDTHLHVNWHIAKPDHLNTGMAVKRLHHQPGWIGKINQPCIRRITLNVTGNIQHDGDRAQRFRKAAGTCRFLTKHAMLHWKLLIQRPCHQPTYAQLRNHKISAGNGFAAVCSAHQFDWQIAQHPLHQIADHFQAIFRNIHQRDLSNW